MLFYRVWNKAKSNNWNLINAKTKYGREKVKYKVQDLCIYIFRHLCLLKRWIVSEHGTIIQTNIDHWSSEPNEDILFSIRRRDLSKRLLNQMQTINEENLWKVITYMNNRVEIYQSIYL